MLNKETNKKLGLGLGLNLGLSINTNNDINRNRLKCKSSNFDDTGVDKELDLFDNENIKITNKCIKDKKFINSDGSYGSIYELDDEKYIKYSDLPMETTKLFARSDIDCNELKMRINKSINENYNSTKYAELSKYFPLNIMHIYSTSKCKNENDFFSNVIEMEKINGITLNQFLFNINLNLEPDQYILSCCIMQLIYIITFSNLLGFVHNDLTLNNIMIYNYDNEFTLDGLIINKNNIKINFKKSRDNIPVVKLIDFSYSTFISKSNGKPDDKIIFGEVKQILFIIKTKLHSLNRKFELLDYINNLFDKKIGSELLSNFSAINNYRLLSDEKIIEYSLNEQEAKKYIFNFLCETFEAITLLFPNDFNFILNNNVKSNYKSIDEINFEPDKKKIKFNHNPNTNDNFFYKKYLKYKNKYIQLKKRIS